MAWPRKIAHAKPHERPKPFDAWYFTAKAKTIADVPMATEILKRVCRDDPNMFDLVNQHLEDAFNAGVEAGKRRGPYKLKEDKE